MAIPLRVLLLDEDARGTASVEGELAGAGYEPVVVRVEDFAGFSAALDGPPFDLVVASRSDRRLASESALEISKSKAPDVPFVVLVDGGAADDGIDLVRRGAADTVRRDALHRLPLTVARELREAASRRQRRRTDEDVRGAEARWSSLSKNAVYGMCRCAADGRFLLVNPALVAMLGYASEDEVLGLDPRRDVFRDRTELDRLIEEATGANRVEGVELAWRRRDGSPVVVRLTGHAVPGAGDSPPGLECIVEDVTARRSLERQLQLSQKMEAIGRLAGGIAHDFNNLLVAILGYSDVLMRQLPEGHRLKKSAEEIHKAGERAASLTRQLLAFSRGQVLDRKPLELGAVVTDMVPMLRRLIGEDVALVTAIDPHRVRVMADRGQVEQILLNLVVNARDAMPRGGTLTLETRSRLEPDALPPSISAGGPFAMLAVLDTGEGMTPEVQARLFEPFFTTKPPGQGTGLGLSTLYGIVKQNLGDVSVASEVGRGSQFRVFLPRTEAPIELSPTDASGAPGSQARPQGETILLVEDEPLVRQIAREILETGGYRVLEAKDGAEAMRIAEETREPFRLMVTDLVLPDTTGLVLTEQLQRRFPDLKVLLTSGYTAQTLDLHGLKRSRAAFLPKPFRPDELLRKVRKVLDVSGTPTAGPAP